MQLVLQDSRNIEIRLLEFIINISSLSITITTAAAIQCQSCSVNITNVTFVERSRAAYVYSSSIITFTGRNIFEGNVAKQGGAIHCLDSRITLLGMNLFIDDAAVELDGSTSPAAAGGAIYCDNSTIKINASESTEFINNTAVSVGGAIAAYNFVLDIEGSVGFLKTQLDLMVELVSYTIQMQHLEHLHLLMAIQLL